MNKTHKLNYLSLLYFILRSSFLSILTPLILRQKENSLITMITGILLGFLFFLIYIHFTKKYSNQNLFEILESVLGQKIGFLLSSFFILSCLFYMALLFLNLTNFIYTEYLHETNFYILLLLIFIFVFYVTNKNIESLFKSAFIFFILSIIFFIIKAIGIFYDVDLSYLYTNLHIDIKTSFYYGIYSILPIFCLCIAPINKIKDHDNLIKYQIITYFLTSLILLLSMFFIITILGPNLANAYFYPEFHLLKSVKLLGFIEKIESILSIGFIFDLYLCLVLLSFTLKEYFKRYSKKFLYVVTFILLFIFCSIYSLSNIKFLVEITFDLFVILLLIFNLILINDKLKNY